MDTTRSRGNVPLLVLLAVMWVVPGLFGHEPWKPDEGYTIGLVANMVNTGNWVVPTLADIPFVEKPPIFFITAALFNSALPADWLPLHQVAALTAAFYVLMTLLFSYLAAREAGGSGAGIGAALGLMGCVGFLVRAHSAITDTALWCGFAVAVYGMLLASRRHWAGAFWFGTGTGLTFLAKGFLGPGFIGLAAAVLPLFCAEKRNFAYCKFLVVAVLFSLPWLVVWPWRLYQESPELFSKWLMENNLGRFLGPEFGFARKATQGKPWKYLAMFPWFTLPLWPPALIAWWRKGRAGFREPGMIYPTLVLVVGMIALSLADTRRELYFIPLLAPLAILACQMRGELPGWVDALLRGLPRLLFPLGGVAVWLVYIGWRLGFPDALMRLLDSRAPGAPAPAGVVVPLVALSYTVICLWVLCKSSLRFRWDWVWAAGFTLVWGVAMLLFLPILDHVKGYYPTFDNMLEHIPNPQVVRIDDYRLGESQRAVLDYYFSVRPRPVDRGGESAEYFLVQNYKKQTYFPDEAAWALIWEGTRPGDKDEVYRLYRFSDAVPSVTTPSP